MQINDKVKALSPVDASIPGNIEEIMQICCRDEVMSAFFLIFNKNKEKITQLTTKLTRYLL